jgi:hypothetical protein
MEHPLDLVEFRQVARGADLIESADIPGNTNLSLELVRRAQSDSKETTELSFRTSAGTFSDVGWHRNARPSDLVTQRVSSRSLEPSGGINELRRQTIGTLPHQKLSEVMHDNRHTRGVDRFLDPRPGHVSLLFTFYCPSAKAD